MSKLRKNMLLFSSLFAALAMPLHSFASEISFTGGASQYAFANMWTPQFGVSVKQNLGNRFYLKLSDQISAKNRDPNGGVANVFSAYSGLNLIKIPIIHPVRLKISPYLVYSNLLYGQLHNNNIGGGLRFSLGNEYNAGILRAEGLYGFDGNIGGTRLTEPCNLWEFYGRYQHRVGTRSYVFTYVRNMRYIDAGNTLDSIQAGLGFKTSF